MGRHSPYLGEAARVLGGQLEERPAGIEQVPLCRHFAADSRRAQRTITQKLIRGTGQTPATVRVIDKHDRSGISCQHSHRNRGVLLLVVESSCVLHAAELEGSVEFVESNLVRATL